MYFGVIFVIAFVLSIIVMVAYANKNYKKETLKTIGNNEKVWEITDKWAAKEGYILKSEDGNRSVFTALDSGGKLMTIEKYWTANLKLLMII